MFTPTPFAIAHAPEPGLMLVEAAPQHEGPALPLDCRQTYKALLDKLTRTQTQIDSVDYSEFTGLMIQFSIYGDWWGAFPCTLLSIDQSSGRVRLFVTVQDLMKHHAFWNEMGL
ncbi:hypothetical protein [Rudanella lutea]|uniref:hypothetical protein n=1 Tax=Rudanella lutea TaxID=451374 RepID=UPI000379EDF8|nr:hypothetical protein [Rudanella lutea]